MRAGFRELNANGVTVLYVSLDDAESHRRFAAKYDLPFRLVCDTEAKIAESYGVLTEITYQGETFAAARRTTFLIDEAGVIVDVLSEIDVDNHAAEILARFGADRRVKESLNS